MDNHNHHDRENPCPVCNPLHAEREAEVESFRKHADSAEKAAVDFSKRLAVVTKERDTLAAENVRLKGNCEVLEKRGNLLLDENVRLREVLKPLAESAEWSEGSSKEWPHRACIGCDMGGAGPGPEDKHDPDCCIDAARRAYLSTPTTSSYAEMVAALRKEHEMNRRVGMLKERREIWDAAEAAIRKAEAE